MSVSVFIIICMFITAISADKFSDYCSLSCTVNGVTYPHTVCMRHKQKCRPASACNIVHFPSMTDKIRQKILDKHNELRNKVAAGKAENQPGASNMKVLNWDYELEFIAQCLANTCNFNHDKCRKTSRFQVGQNLAMMGTSDKKGLSGETTARVTAWYNEVFNMKSDFIRSFPDKYTGPVIGHYTQLVWADAEYVGCGRIVFEVKGMHILHLVCNYGGGKSPGNMVGNSIYETGAACSKCEGKPCNSKYNALCGETYAVSDLDKDGWIIGAAAGISPNKYLLVLTLLACGLIVHLYV